MGRRARQRLRAAQRASRQGDGTGDPRLRGRPALEARRGLSRVLTSAALAATLLDDGLTPLLDRRGVESFAVEAARDVALDLPPTHNRRFGGSLVLVQHPLHGNPD